jgi:arylsulfatase A
MLKLLLKRIPYLIITIFISCKEQNMSIENHPNIVFILADDLGWRDTGCYGSSFYETPNIDRLATEGVRFSNAYAACHVCSPTRASIITGEYPARLNLTDWLPGRRDFPFQKLKNVEIYQHLPYDQNPLPKVLKENGYHTAIIGKWHLGEDSASIFRQGFEMHIPEWNKGWPNNTYFSPYGMKGLEGGKKGEYLTDRLTDEALKYIENNNNHPFFLYLAHFAVHDPIQGRGDLVVKYEQKLRKRPRETGPPYILEGNPDSKTAPSNDELEPNLKSDQFRGFSQLPDETVKIKQHQDNVQFAAMVESLDESVGRILEKLKELGMEENTIIIFFSDNGGMSAANFGNPERRISACELDKAFSTSNLPLRGGKGWLYEGGIREPLIIKWPGHTQAGEVIDRLVISTDFYSTIIDMIGIETSDSGTNGIDGLSLVPLINNPQDPISEFSNRALYWHFPHYSNHGMQSPGGAIRYGDFKLLEYFENNTIQLFNLKADPEEQNDLSGSEPEKVSQLRSMLHDWRKEVGARMMTPNPDYKPGKIN